MTDKIDRNIYFCRSTEWPIERRTLRKANFTLCNFWMLIYLLKATGLFGVAQCTISDTGTNMVAVALSLVGCDIVVIFNFVLGIWYWSLPFENWILLSSHMTHVESKSDRCAGKFAWMTWCASRGPIHTAMHRLTDVACPCQTKSSQLRPVSVYIV